MSSIIIESSPISSAGFCRATNGQSIIFKIVSGITSSTVYCEWFLNGNSVYFGSSYILLIPKTNDEVYARVVNCSGETLRTGNWIEDNMFYYNDVKSGTSTYYIDLKASFDYKILSSVFKSNSGGAVKITIDDVPIIWTDSGNTIPAISNSIVDTEAIRLNYVSIGQKVKLITSGSTQNVIRGKVRFIRVMKNYVTPLPTTTTTTTSSTTTTTTTTLPPTTTTTTTLSMYEYCFSPFYACEDPTHVPPGGDVTWYDEYGVSNYEDGYCGIDNVYSFLSSRNPIFHGMGLVDCNTPIPTTNVTIRSVTISPSHTTALRVEWCYSNNSGSPLIMKIKISNITKGTIYYYSTGVSVNNGTNCAVYQILNAELYQTNNNGDEFSFEGSLDNGYTWSLPVDNNSILQIIPYNGLV